MSKQELLHSTAVEAAKGTPPVIVTATAQINAWTGADVITFLTITYLALQIMWLLWRWWKSAKTGQVQP